MLRSDKSRTLQISKESTGGAQDATQYSAMVSCWEKAHFRQGAVPPHTVANCVVFGLSFGLSFALK